MKNATMPHQTANRSGFTLIELLVVIAIISILLVIGLSVGAAVTESGRKQVTTNVVRALDTMVESYVAEIGTNPPGIVEDPTDTSPAEQRRLLPIIDGRNFSGAGQPAEGTFINTVGLFLSHVEGIAGISGLVDEIDPDLVKLYDPDSGIDNGATNIAPADGGQPELRTILDGWGRPIRMVHPKFDGLIYQSYTFGSTRRSTGTFGGEISLTTCVGGAGGITDDPFGICREYTPAERAQRFRLTQVRRDYLSERDRREWTGDSDPIGDSDGGSTPSARPYFYSAGGDADPSTREDNIYTRTPKFTADVD